jgi:hypothetical protein
MHFAVDIEMMQNLLQVHSFDFNYYFYFVSLNFLTVVLKDWRICCFVLFKVLILELNKSNVSFESYAIV